MNTFTEAPCSSQLAEQLADSVCKQIALSIEHKGQAVIALSGGSTPKPLFQTLQHRDINWPSVVITLVDERWVPTTHQLSNAAFLERHLLSCIPSARFAPLYQHAESAQASVLEVLEGYADMTNSSIAQPAPFDVVILGMGEDGHTASFFPDALNIDELIDAEQQQPLLTCESPSTQVPRITWSLPMLVNTQFLALHFTGTNKRAVFSEAEKAGPANTLPVRAVIHQSQTTLNVFYSE